MNMIIKKLQMFKMIEIIYMKNSFLSYCNFNSPLRFLLVLNRFRRTAYSSLTSKLWTLTSQMMLTSPMTSALFLSFQDSQNKVITQKQRLSKIDFFINAQKTKTIIINSKQTDSIKISNDEVEDNRQKRPHILRKYCQYIRST